MLLQPRLDLERTHKQLVVFGYFLGILHSQKDDYDYCNTLRLKIIPFIRLIAPKLVNKWVQEKEDYILKRERLKRKVMKEIEDILEVLKQRLEKAGLLNAPEIMEVCLSLESILKFIPEDKKIWVMPEQYKIAFERLKNVCYAIVQLRRKDIVEDYVGEFIWDFDIRYFNKKSFVPSYFELCKSNEIFLNSASMAWDKLCSIEWGWQTHRRDDFRKKKLDYNFRKKSSIICNHKAADRSRKLLNANFYWYKVKAVKERKKSKSTFLTQKDLARCVHLVASKIGVEFTGIITDDVACSPEAIRLSLEDDRELRLIIQWAEGFCEVKHLHTFHDPDNGTNVRYDFFKNMIQRLGDIIIIDPVSGAKAIKYLQDIGLYGVLDTLFVGCKRGNKAALISDQIDLVGLPEIVICDLKNHLETLETLGWRKTISSILF